MSNDKIVNLHSHDDPQLEALYQQAGKPLPPTHLDAAIKQAARQPLAPKRSKLTPWFAGVAASVLIGVLFIRLYPTALPPRPASYLEQESRPATTPAAESVAREPAQASPAAIDSLRDMPAKSSGASQLNQMRQAPDSYDQAAERKREMPGLMLERQVPMPGQEQNEMLSSPAMKSMGSSGASVEEADMAPELPAETSALSKQENITDPQAMLEHILELLELGKTEDAKHAYREFRQRHPGYELKPEIAEHLKAL